ncbi:MAG: glycosyltransferase [Candidatus Obscuribacterales bacterium]|nr:glycosyltransferase [Candidatus Obscuribacterales bacterium]
MVEKNKTTAFRHYAEHGIREGRSPNILFDVDFYIKHNNEISASFPQDRKAAVIDYLFNKKRKLLATHPLFDAKWYMSNNKDVEAAFKKNFTYPLRHFLDFGAKEGRSPHPIFDTEWYLKNYPDAKSAVLSGSMTAIEHYLQLGARHGFSPSASFNSRWYLNRNRDVAILAAKGLTDAASHYLSLGKLEQRHIRSHSVSTVEGSSTLASPYSWGSPASLQTSENTLLYALSENPLVSIVIVNHNGSAHLGELFRSLRDQTYQNYEIIFVDNNSIDNSRDLVKRLRPDCFILHLDKNYGFAEANNIGCRHARGELFALLNNDTKVEPDWLYSLVNAMKYNLTAGAVASKIRFWTKFSSIELSSAKSFTLDLKFLRGSLSYKKYFVDYGVVDSDYLHAASQGNHHVVSLKIPLQEDPFELRILGQERKQIVHLQTNNNNSKLILDDTWTDHIYSWPSRVLRSGKFVINNAGSTEDADHNTGDRGFGSYDEGQFDEIEEVSSICGCSVLVRRDALLGMDLFVGAFVAYFEDNELSRRLKNNGFTLIYCPLSVVYHKHSATSKEKSVFWLTYVTRNRILYKYMALDATRRDAFLAEQLENLTHQVEYFSKEANIKNVDDKNYFQALPNIVNGVSFLSKTIADGQIVTKSSVRVGVYNNFWRTLGGGEAHALNIAQVLGDISTVELISINDFDLEELLSYFGVKKFAVRKRIINEMTPEITAEYDVFVNSTYMSECPSLAKTSFYVVSFPSKTPTVEFLQSYKFLANGEFSLEWMHKIWGTDNFSAEVLYPAVSSKLCRPFVPVQASKERIILSVGRFFSDGHCKNQHIISDIFKKFSRTLEGENWKLMLIGSSNDDRYFEEIIASLSGFNAEIVTDASIDFLASAYQRASVYIHAAGYGHNVNHSPENFEHFGMTIVEAAMNGCFPIVYGQAGPKEIVEKLGAGFCYYTIDEALNSLTHHAHVVREKDAAYFLADNVARTARMHFQVSQTEGNLNTISAALSLDTIRNMTGNFSSAVTRTEDSRGR